MLTTVKQSLQGLLQLLYPRNCEACNNWLTEAEEVLCLQCMVLLPRTGFCHMADNQAMQNFTGRILLQYATSFVYFSPEGMMQHLIHRFKYKDRPAIGRYLGRLFGEELKAVDQLKDIEVIVPVPLHSKKEYKRGYNQSAVIAEGINQILNIRTIPDCLVRTVNNESQTHKTRPERIQNVAGIFTVRNKESIVGKHILLVDDVLTTGATLESAANELLKINNVRVSIATIALAID